MDKAQTATLLRKEIEEIANRLCLAVSGEFDFTIETHTLDESVQKLSMLVNFVLDAARRALSDIEEKNLKLMELDKLKSKFMENVSHELRTPLTLILGPLETILKDASDPTQLESLQRIQRNAVRLYMLVNDILDFSKLEAEKFILHEELLNLGMVVSQIVEDAQGLAKERKLTLRYSQSQGLTSLWFDQKLIEKILINLISNALKFTPEGGNILVKLERKKETVCLTVSDTGIGIPSMHLPHLFERFYQVDSSSTRTYEGTGIGLSVVYQFVHLIKGKITVESEEGKGSTFIVTLPIHISEDNLVPPLSLTAFKNHPPLFLNKDVFSKLATEPSKFNMESSRQKIEGKLPLLLIVEDNPDVRGYIASLLKNSYEFIMADNGKLALEAIYQHHPHVVLSDVMMPIMNGYELTKIIKSDPKIKHIPIILITAHAGIQAITNSMEIGADDYLAKPFSPEELIARTHSALRLYQNYMQFIATNKKLTNEIMERKKAEKKAARLSSQLISAARYAGMADIATSVLHNIGNVLNSVNVSVSILEENTNKNDFNNLSQIVNLLNKHEANISKFLTEDPKGKLIPNYLKELIEILCDAHKKYINEMNELKDQIKHIEDIVGMQRDISGISGVKEKIFLPTIVNKAIKICGDSMENNNIIVERDFKYFPFLITDKSKIIQILVNLIQNAKDAFSLADYNISCKKIQISIERPNFFPGSTSAMIQIDVKDNGIGIKPENLSKIFTFGFTTKPTGHGFGLHSSALAAKELGGILKVKSRGWKKGATFTLTLPIK